MITEKIITHHHTFQIMLFIAQFFSTEYKLNNERLVSMHISCCYRNAMHLSPATWSLNKNVFLHFLLLLILTSLLSPLSWQPLQYSHSVCSSTYRLFLSLMRSCCCSFYLCFSLYGHACVFIRLSSMCLSQSLAPSRLEPFCEKGLEHFNLTQSWWVSSLGKHNVSWLFIKSVE